MILSNCILHIELPEAHSLKGRRSVTASIRDRLKKFNVSVLDISGEYVREGDLAFAFLAHDARQAARYLQSVEMTLSRYYGEYEATVEYEIL